MAGVTRSYCLRCGTLHLSNLRGGMELDELCGYASRRSRKRGFVFVSKVLGKHFPVRPSTMSDVHERLAGKLKDLPGPVTWIAMAETATALGQGVYEAWRRGRNRDDSLFLHTTRYRLHRPLALDFEESHSHATRHFLYEPSDPGLAVLFRQATTLVLVDDEISTGRTLAKLAAAYRRVNPRLRSVRVVSITDWLGQQDRTEMLGRIGVPASFSSLLQGSFALEEDPSFVPGRIPDVTGAGEFKDDLLPITSGRLGTSGLWDADLETLVEMAGVRPGERVLVLGTGEFAYPPFLLARRLEEMGHDVQYQSTTRSPLLADGIISSSLEFIDNYHDDIANYVYNVTDRHYDRILICYETSPLPARHTLGALLKAQPLFFPPRMAAIAPA